MNRRKKNKTREGRNKKKGVISRQGEKGKDFYSFKSLSLSLSLSLDDQKKKEIEK